MKNFILVLIQLLGYGLIFVSCLSFLNYLFDWRLGYQGSEVPKDIEFAIVFLVLGGIISLVGWFFNRNTVV
jgi:hypothetical protein